jgi:hypothetical protein
MRIHLATAYATADTYLPLFFLAGRRLPGVVWKRILDPASCTLPLAHRPQGAGCGAEPVPPLHCRYLGAVERFRARGRVSARRLAASEVSHGQQRADQEVLRPPRWGPAVLRI